MYQELRETSRSSRKFFLCTQAMKIKDWNRGERPREKLMERGATSLTDSELLAIIINTGRAGMSAVELGRELLSAADYSLNRLSAFSLEQLVAVNGIGEAKATLLKALFELSSRISNEEINNSAVITSSEDVGRLFIPVMRNLTHEECWVLFLNKAGRVISKERVSIGGVSSTVMDVRVILKSAVEKLATAIIVVHNHPSGNPNPGKQDKEQTRLLRNAAAIFDIALLDHVVIAGNKYFSFSDEGM